MKDIFELLNNIQIDSSEVMETTDEEKEKYKKWVKAKINKRKRLKWKNMALAGAVICVVFVTGLTALSFTTWAEEIPILKSVFHLFSKDGPYESFSDEAEALGIVSVHNGIKISLEEAVFDGKMFFFTLTIDSENDLGDDLFLDGDLEVNARQSVIQSRWQEIRKIGEHQYVGIIAGHLYKPVEQADFSWNITSIFPMFADEKKKVHGKWNFNFSLSALDTITQIVTPPTKRNVAFYDKVREEGVLVEIVSITYTPMSFIINYNEYVAHEKYDEWDFIITDIKVRDDLGNEYIGERFGGYGSENNIYSRLRMTRLFNKLDPDATKLIVTPVVRYAMADGVHEHGGLYRDFNSTAPEEFVELDEIVIDIEK